MRIMLKYIEAFFMEHVLAVFLNPNSIARTHKWLRVIELKVFKYELKEKN